MFSIIKNSDYCEFKNNKNCECEKGERIWSLIWFHFYFKKILNCRTATIKIHYTRILIFKKIYKVKKKIHVHLTAYLYPATQNASELLQLVLKTKDLFACWS